MIAIVTGASAGLGAQFARQIVEQFPEIDTLWLIARRVGKLEDLAQTIEGKQVICLGLDLCDAKSFKYFADHLAEKRPKVGLLVNNAGCGTLGVLLCARDPSCTVAGIELRPEACRAAQENVRINGLEERLTVQEGDVRRIRTLLPAGDFSCVIANPPYFPVGSGKAGRNSAVARTEQCLTLAELCTAAAWLLPPGGRFALVHRAERLCDLLCALRAAGLEPKRVQPVRHNAESPVSLLLLEARRGGRPGLTLLPELLEYETDGTEREALRAARHAKGDCP